MLAVFGAYAALAFIGAWSIRAHHYVINHHTSRATTDTAMTIHTLMLICGTIAASAQAPDAVAPGSQQGPTVQPTPGGSTTQDQDHDSFSGHHGVRENPD
jgi:hypothetical protein